MRQYEIWWATLPEPVGRRPVLLLSRDAAFNYLTRVIVAEVTSMIRGIPEEVTLGAAEGLGRPCVANLDNLHVVALSRLSVRIGALGQRRRIEVKRALGYALGWAELEAL
ncbi:MAG: type II toxin-antitoxin system PemK/MazF family toxin [Deltaproteobacteria bacterium]|nr:type II toxin-antitoxin system PemK/MazF family toxin [Deltaproteobacteria bacterium]